MERKHTLIRIAVSLMWSLLLAAFSWPMTAEANSNCDPEVQTHHVDLTGNPDSVWSDQGLSLGGTCCPQDQAGNNCVEIVLTLDEEAKSIVFELGGAPGFGAVDIQLDCGEIYKVGDLICIQDPGPHHITLCRPGNPTYDVELTSLSTPSVTPDLLVAESCQDTLHVEGMDPESITWETVDPQQSQYLDYLSCTEGCASSIVQPTDNNPPDSIIYQACGVRDSGCEGDTICVTSKVFFVTDLEVSHSPVDPVVCYNDNTVPVTAIGAGGEGDYTFEWSGGQSGKTVNLPEGEHTVYMYDNTDCPPASHTFEVAKQEEETVADAGEDILLCNNETAVELNGEVVNAADGFWIGNDGTFDPGKADMQTTYFPSEGEMNSEAFQLYLVAVNPLEHCSNDTATLNIDVQPSPDTEIHGPAEVCAFQGGYTYDTDEEAGHSYQWNVDGGNIISADDEHSISVEWGEPGSGLVTLTRTDDATGCDSTETMQIEILDAPVPEIEGPEEVCSFTDGHTYSITNSANHSYHWTVEGGNLNAPANQPTAEVEWGENGTGEISVTKTNNETGCEATASMLVTIVERPGAEITGDMQVCESFSGLYESVSTNDGAQYNWTVIEGGILLSNQNAETAEVRWEEAGFGSLMLETVNANGECPTTDTVEVKVSTNPEPVIEGRENVCTEYTTHYTTNIIPEPKMDFQWEVDGGTILGSDTQSDIEIIWGQSGNGTIKFSVTDHSTGCSGEATLEVEIHDGIKPEITGPVEACATLDHDYIYSVTDDEVFEYKWDVTLGSVVGADNEAEVNIDWEEEGTGTVIIERINTLSGCIEGDTLSVDVESEPQTEITGAEVVCVLGDSYYYDVDYWPDTEYEWFVEGGEIVSGQGTHEVEIAWEDVDTGIVEMQAQRESVCDELISMTVVIATYTEGDLSLQTYEGCAPFVPSLANLEMVNITHIEWDYGDGRTSNRIQPREAFEEPGEYEIQVYAENDFGCEDTFRYEITVLPVPDASFVFNPDPDEEKVFDEQEFEVINNSSGAIFYEWYFGNDDTLYTPSDQSIILAYEDPDTYEFTLVAENEHGCTDRMVRDIRIYSLEWVRIPNAFSPNGDGINDKFYVKTRNLSDFKVRIIDRWGEIMYVSDDVDFEWDGKYRGETLPEGVYVYQIQAVGISGERYHKNGTIKLIR